MDKSQSVPTSVPIKKNINDLLLRLRLKYSIPKLYTPKDEKGKTTLDKRWHVYFYFDNPKTGKRTANDKFIKHHGINRYTTISQRREFGKRLVEEYTKMLADGWDPYENKMHLNRNLTFEVQKTNIIEAIERAMRNKERTLKKTSYKDLEWRLRRFVQFAKAHKFENINSKELNRFHVVRFLEERQEAGENATSINNYRTAISSVVSQMVQDGNMEVNFVRDIPKQRAKAVKNHPFNELQIKEIKEFLAKENPQLLNYIRVLAFSFLRTREVADLRVEDVELRFKQLTVRGTKSKAIEKIYIIEPLQKIFENMQLDDYLGHFNIFTPEHKVAEWNSAIGSKSNYFSKQFRQVKKHFNFGDEYGIYSFRHSFAVYLLDSFMENGLTYTEAVNKMLPITRHKSVQALENYLREKQGMLPKDYTLDLVIDF